MIRKSRLLGMLGVAGITLASGSAFAATEAQKQTAIDSGLAYLAAHQAANGSWCETGYCDADTSAAMLAFIEQKTKPAGWNGVDYSAVVDKGLKYILGNGVPWSVGSRADGQNADRNGNHLGVQWGYGESTYVTGLVLPTLSRAVTAGIVNADDPLPVTPSGYNPHPGPAQWKDLIQDTVDTFLQGQTTGAGNPYRGGWRYTPSSGDSDGSTAQWPAIGMLFAETVPGIDVPNYTKDELKYWIDYIQSSTNGSAGYTDPAGFSGIPNSESKTGGLLVQMAFTGYDGNGGPTDTGGVSDRDGAIAYLNAHWQDAPVGWGNPWVGDLGHPYAMWSVYKGLESNIGLSDTTHIANLAGCGALDAGDVCNWWQDYSEFLVNSQQLDGAWPGYTYWPSDLATAWNINILNATAVGPIPEPGTLSLLGLGLLGMRRLRQRQRRAVV